MSWRDTPPEFTMPTFCCAQEQNKSEICTQSRQKLGLERQKERGDASPHEGVAAGAKRCSPLCSRRGQRPAEIHLWLLLGHVLTPPHLSPAFRAQTSPLADSLHPSEEQRGARSVASGVQKPESKRDPKKIEARGEAHLASPPQRRGNEAKPGANEVSPAITCVLLGPAISVEASIWKRHARAGKSP